MGLPLVIVMAFAMASAAVLVLMLWALPLGLMREATGCSIRRMWGLLLYLPVHWLIMAVLGIGVILMFMLGFEELRRVGR
jgi:hypothetical protein